MHVVAGDLFCQPAGKKISSFLKQFTNRSSRDMRFPKVRLGMQSSHSRIVEGSRLEFSFDSRRLGAVNCIGWMTPSINIIGGNHDGWSWFWELKHIENRARYEKEYKTALDTELLWEVYAASHDRLLKHLPYYNTVRERHEQVMKLAGDEILDVGAGTGNVTLPLLDSGKNVTAIDSSRSMLNHLRAKLAGRFSENLKVFRMSAEDLSRFPENSFDGVTAMMSLYCIKGNGKQRAFDECLRVLKPNGRIVITDIKKDLAKNYEHLRIRARGEFDEVLKMFPEDRTKEMNGHWDRVEECGRSLSKGSNDDPGITELHEMLVERGFSGVELIDSHYGICATIIGVHP